MNKLLAAGALLALGTLGAHAADLSAPIVDTPAVAPAAAPGIYLQLLGGAAAGLDADFFHEDDSLGSLGTDLGGAFGLSAGIMVTDNVSIDLDYLHTSRSYHDIASDAGVTTDSVMADAKYQIPVSDRIGLYVGAGLGWIGATDYEELFADESYSGFGFQLLAGMSVAVTDHISLVSELRYQDGFSNLNDGDYNIHAPVAAALAGLKFSF